MKIKLNNQIKIVKIFFGAILMFFVLGLSNAQHGRRGDYGSDPMQIFNRIVDDSNNGGYAIQETALDGITDGEGSYPRAYKVSNTLDYIRKNIDPYLQWIIYVGLVLATIALIYSGFLLVTHATHKQGDRSKMKTSLLNVLVGVLLLTGFYFIIKVIVALVTSIFGGATGNSGF